MPILVELRKSDPLFEVKCAFYRRDLSIPFRRVRVSIGDNENFKLLFAVLRVVEADREDFDLLVSCSGNSLYRSLRDAQIPISVRNEMAVLKSLLAMCDQLLSSYPTTCVQDKDRLLCGDVPLFSNERNALIQVKGEKEVLLFFKALAESSIALLESEGMLRFDEQLEALRTSKHPIIYHYARGTLSRLHQDELRRNEIRQRKLDLSRPTVV